MFDSIYWNEFIVHDLKTSKNSSFIYFEDIEINVMKSFLHQFEILRCYAKKDIYIFVPFNLAKFFESYISTFSV